MTERRDEASGLPLSVTFTPDGQIAEALQALVGRVGELTGDPERARPFTAAVRDVVRWLEAHRESVVGDVALVLDRADQTLSGELRWAARDAAAPAPPIATAADGVDLTCDVAGTEVHCRVSCACA